MSTALDTELLGAELSAMLQETDPDRPLDSLESTVALIWVRNHGTPEPATHEQRPTTIGGWVAWVARHSSAS